MEDTPGESALRWAAKVVGANATVAAVRGLHDGGSPWLLQVEHSPNFREVILRIPDMVRVGPRGIATGAAALLFAEEHGIAAPRLIASDPDGRETGIIMTLETVLVGNSDLPPRVSVERLREAGAAIAKVHAVSLEPQSDLPLRTRPIQDDDYAMERRMSKTPSSTLLLRADDRVRAYDRPPEATVFVHGDVWGGNMRWVGDTCTALIDWKTAGAGNPGVDLGELRMQMALQYGSSAADHVLEGWQRQSDRAATHVPYWDIVAALNTPMDMSGWPGFDDRDHPLDAASISERRDDFLRRALDQLEK
jgi:aminoglycoside phosphotransferase (APT) family kinase protein